MRTSFFLFGTLLILTIFFLISCKLQEDKDGFIISYSDNFESGLEEFWHKEFSDSTRGIIVNDPTNIKNKVLKVKIDTDDYHSGGKRSELVAYPKDSIGYITRYSFRFLLPDSFFMKEKKKSWIMIHQWHDYPAPGFNWKTYNRITRPPVHLFIQHNPNGDYFLYFTSGLKIGELNEIKHFKYNQKLEPNKWYNFSCDIKWGVYSLYSYAKPKINNEYFTDLTSNGNYKKIKVINRRNMYNSIPNSFKFGLYWDGSQEHEREILFDDIIIKSKKDM